MAQSPCYLTPSIPLSTSLSSVFFSRARREREDPLRVMASRCGGGALACRTSTSSNTHTVSVCFPPQDHIQHGCGCETCVSFPWKSRRHSRSRSFFTQRALLGRVFPPFRLFFYWETLFASDLLFTRLERLMIIDWGLRSIVAPRRRFYFFPPCFLFFFFNASRCIIHRMAKIYILHLGNRLHRSLPKNCHFPVRSPGCFISIY